MKHQEEEEEEESNFTMETKTKNNKYIKPVCKRYNTKKKKKEKESRIACLSFNKLNIIPLRTFLPFKGRKKKLKTLRREIISPLETKIKRNAR